MASKERRKLERKKERLALAIAALEQATEPEPGLLIDAAEPEPEPAVDWLPETEVAPIDAAEPEPEPEPVPGLDWPAEPNSEPVEIEAEPSGPVAAEPEPIIWADVIPEPVPEHKPVETEELPYARPKKGKKDKKKDKKGKKDEIKEDVCVWKATHLVDGGWEDCSSCRRYVGSFVSSYHQSKEDSSLGI
ncbi:hypothetical protein ColLi_12811 [Colletotrichum liriopes]|uniref:Uncharacterized protein n=1 Tax=Colletotrichum liriopes TaxID=708192 RepID=A0AA37GZ23_9PEZI|nr:hypothetical protein ColLi_12811 [Colletotrichum liriopes]